jgi:hypothetical protein
MNTDGYGAFKMYAALKLHFTTKSYDYHYYNGKTNLKPGSYAKRNDRFFFTKLAKRLPSKDLTDYFVSNFVAGKIWIGDFSDAIYHDCMKRQQAISYNFTQELDSVIAGADPKSVFLSKENEYSTLFSHYLRGNVSIETMTLLNKFIGLGKKYDAEMKDDIIWQQHRLRIMKYESFLHYNGHKISKILREKLQLSG